jgi:uncharacterized membrane protein
VPHVQLIKIKHFQEQMSSQFVSPVSQHTHTHTHIYTLNLTLAIIPSLSLSVLESKQRNIERT